MSIKSASKRIFFFSSIFFCLSISSKLIAQPLLLLPSIGIDHLPANDEDICDIPLRLGTNFAEMGLQIGDSFSDFTFYTIDGDSVNLKSTLEAGKPVVLITSSYTCYVFRSQLDAIKELQTDYGDQVTILLMYIIEAHPITDINPYFGYVNPSFQNFQDSIFYNEPIVYGDRVATATDMINDLDILIPVILDGPCNEFWTYSECGPNTAYLIDTSGIIATKHGWFNNQGQDMGASIDSLLGNPVEDQGESNGQIVFDLTSSIVIHGAPGSFLYFTGTIENVDTSDATVEIVAKSIEFPDDWLFTLCADVCYPPGIDSISFIVDAGKTINFGLDMLTSDIEEFGYINVVIKNHFHPDESYSYTLKGITDSSLVSAPLVTNDENKIKVFPNPSSTEINISSGKSTGNYATMELIDVRGSVILKQQLLSALEKISVVDLEQGIYLLKVTDSGSITESKIVIIE
ncbi:MAG: T9SS type A sorting domain-containing protein [Chitinophagales bacterium]|nr:T9SS type A sorting domain-containing protein [Chitinophagales bacterium]